MEPTGLGVRVMHEIDNEEAANLARHVALLSKLGRDEPAILDVGANSGAVTDYYLQLAPRATVHAVEPTPALARTLRERFGERVTVHECALGAAPGSAELNVYRDDTVTSLLTVDERLAARSPHYSLERTVSVEVRTLDDLCFGGADEPWFLPDLLKIDTQGYDLNVLRGGARLIAEHPPSLIQVEMTIASQYEGQAGFQDLWSFVSARGYRLFDFERLVHTSSGNLYYGDALFVSSSAWSGLGLL